MAKVSDDPAPNEDSFGRHGTRQIYVVSDGASESFDSARWSRFLVRFFLRNPELSGDWINCAASAYGRRINRSTLSWSAQAAFDRGSFATLTGVVFSPTRTCVTITGIGDSLAVLAVDGKLRASYPYNNPCQFSKRPLLLSTNRERNQELLATPMLKFQAEWTLSEFHQPVILLMTDALGAWLLDNPDERLPTLLDLDSELRFRMLVENERCGGTIRRDDTTLLVIR